MVAAVPGVAAALGPAQLPRLRQVVVRGNHLGEAAVRALGEALAQVRFFLTDYPLVGCQVEEPVLEASEVGM